MKCAKWSKFIENGFLTHQQSGIKIYLYAVNPSSIHLHMEHLSDFIKKVNPAVVGLHMGTKHIIPDSTRQNTRLYTEDATFEDTTITADSFTSALEVSRERKSFTGSDCTDRVKSK